MTQRESPSPDDAVRALEAHLEQSYLITKTFASLQLYDPTAIADTLLSLTATFAQASAGCVVLREGPSLRVAAVHGTIERQLLESPDSVAFLREQVEGGVTRSVGPGELAQAPTLARAFPDGLVVAALRKGDEALGAVVVARSSEASPELGRLAFLTTAAGIGSLALTTAAAVAAQRELAEGLEASASAAREEAEAKARLAAELDAKLLTIQAQADEILALSTPVLEVWRDVLVVPIIGRIDAKRGGAIVERLVEAAARSGAKYVIVDLTGVAIVDTSTADQIVRMVRCLELLGTHAIIAGFQPAVAQTVVSLGVELAQIPTLRNLERGLSYCLARVDAASAKR